MKISEMVEILEKGKKYPVGTVKNGRKKVAEGKWVKVKDEKKEEKKQEQKRVHNDPIDEAVRLYEAGDVKASRGMLKEIEEELGGMGIAEYKAIVGDLKRQKRKK